MKIIPSADRETTTMIMDWTRSDLIACIALIVAIAAACFTGWQTLIARRKEKREIEDATPTADVVVSHADGLGQNEIYVRFRNRSTEFVSDIHITVEKPRGVSFVFYPARDIIIDASKAVRKPLAVLSEYAAPQSEAKQTLLIDAGDRQRPFKALFVVTYVSRGSRERSSKIDLRRTIP